jgi:hypothetical protein
VLTKAILATLAATACAAGSLIAEVPAQAQPLFPVPATPTTDCDWTIFATDSDIAFSGHLAHVSWGSHDASATFDNSQFRAPLSGPIIVKGTNELDFTIHMREQIQNPEYQPAFTNTYSGTIDPGGSASGMWHNDQGGSGTWTMPHTFKCIARGPAAAPPPPAGQQAPPPAEQAPPPPVTDAITLSFTSTATTITATVTNSSAKPGNCHYEATAPFTLPTTRDFKVGKNSSTQLQFNGLALHVTYHVVVNCLDSTASQQEPIGHVEQDVTF